MTDEEWAQMRKNVRRLASLSKKVSAMPDRFSEEAKKYVEENSFWLNPDSISLLEEGKEYKVLEVQEVYTGDVVYKRARIIKIDNLAISREDLGL